MTALPWVLFSGAAYIAVTTMIATWRQYGQAMLALPGQLRFCLEFCETSHAQHECEWRLVLVKLAALHDLVREMLEPRWDCLKLGAPTH